MGRHADGETREWGDARMGRHANGKTREWGDTRTGGVRTFAAMGSIWGCQLERLWRSMPGTTRSPPMSSPFGAPTPSLAVEMRPGLTSSDGMPRNLAGDGSGRVDPWMPKTPDFWTPLRPTPGPMTDAPPPTEFHSTSMAAERLDVIVLCVPCIPMKRSGARRRDANVCRNYRGECVHRKGASQDEGVWTACECDCGSEWASVVPVHVCGVHDVGVHVDARTDGPLQRGASVVGDVQHSECIAVHVPVSSNVVRAAAVHV